MVRSDDSTSKPLSRPSTWRAVAGRPSETRTPKWPPAPISKTPAPKRTPESCARRQCAAAGTTVPSSSLTSRVKLTALPHDTDERLRQTLRVVAHDVALRRHLGVNHLDARLPQAVLVHDHRACAEALVAGDQIRGDRGVVDQHDVDEPGETDGYTAADHLDALHRHGLAGLRHDVADVHHPPPGLLERGADLGDQQVGDDARVEAAWAEDDEIGPAQRGDGLRQRSRCC